jgi:hypothetical protein
MPDISMCTNDECPLNKTCYRYRATPNPHRQSYAGFKPDENGECEYYWEIEDDKIDTEKK